MSKGNFIEYVVSDNPDKYPNDGELNGYYYETVEDVIPEVTAQTPVITQIAENLGVTITTPSGTNKQILQGNNANLLNIKNNAKKEGLNVWKKSIYAPEVTITNPSFKATTKYDKNIVISDENFDLTKVTDYKKFFVNFKVSSSCYFDTYNSYTGQLGWYFNGSNAPIKSFEPTNKRLVLETNASSPYSNFTGTFTFSGTKTFPAGAGELLGFVVDDDPSAYPNGAVHTDGYYYELLGQATSANVMNLSDNAVMTVQSDYREQIVSEVSQS